MKFKTSILCLFLASALFIGCNSDSDTTGNVALDNNIDSVSYSLGYQIGSMSLKPQGMTDVKTQKIASGIQAALEDQEAQISQQKMQQIVQRYQMQAKQRAQKEQMKTGRENTEKGKEFLAENKKKEEVQVTESGLQYKVLEEGSGASPDSSDQVRVDYEGSLIDGEVFDSSYERGEPATFPLNKVIPGWTEGLQLMEEGAKYKFFIPGRIAYGQNPPPRSPIGPNETLIFEVELLEVNPEDTTSSNQ